jgi:hypothetical protein
LFSTWSGESLTESILDVSLFGISSSVLILQKLEIRPLVIYMKNAKNCLLHQIWTPKVFIRIDWKICMGKIHEDLQKCADNFKKRSA